MNGKKEVNKNHNHNHVLHEMIHKVEFRPKDLLQVIIGASILAVPVGFTEETWRLGELLPWFNVLGLLIISLIFISSFVYYTHHSEKLQLHTHSFLLRVIATYLFSFLVVAVLLALIQVAPWTTDWTLALKRVIIVTFPSSMSAAVADTIK